ncbi:unnamed protein product [Heterobilharzia americana]|nr:unnamed protein product [Heterobilharzia americana]
MEVTNSAEGVGVPVTDVSATFDDEHANFRLFKAYKEGQLDLNILSTQDAISASSAVIGSASASSSSAVLNDSQQEENPKQSLPKSWCGLPSSAEMNQSPNKKLTLGLFFKPKPPSDIIDSTCESQGPSIIRVPVSSVDSADDNKRTQTGTVLPRGSAILVNQRQRGNVVLKQIRNVAWEYADIEPDFVVGRNNCVYFLRYPIFVTTEIHRNYLFIRK